MCLQNIAMRKLLGILSLAMIVACTTAKKENPLAGEWHVKTVHFENEAEMLQSKDSLFIKAVLESNKETEKSLVLSFNEDSTLHIVTNKAERAVFNYKLDTAKHLILLSAHGENSPMPSSDFQLEKLSNDTMIIMDSRGLGDMPKLRYELYRKHEAEKK